jgi:hypothetical protein
MKNKLIVGAILLLAGFLCGFIPQYERVSTLTQMNQELRNQLNAAKRAESVNSFRNRAALIYSVAAKNNFSLASESASKFFTDLQEFATQSADVSLKQNLGEVLSSRDAIIGGLAKADPTVAAQIQELFLKMQNIQP